ncbi:MAG: DNA recombination protein RmuC [Gammaproteobacteria bacterium]|nr:DNA recombination protein RmuC [Gammaproteobacteria bacterium]MCZ6716967.1 DNA recombination protein RmuC [Gammaproteobacteria bacterium]MCZ6826127.1 DNA recombination protein RmuC [Gammaproteobacteria bacterium]MCZ6911271.1 DNA recombination protein RmuC [Pseudomonadota bacterium]
MTGAATQNLIWFLAAAGLAGLIVGTMAASLYLLNKISSMRARNSALESQLKSQDQLQEERQEALKQAETRLAASMIEQTGKSFRDHSETFLKLAKENLGSHQEKAHGQMQAKEKAIEALIKPVAEALKKTEEQLLRIEKERKEAYGSIYKELESVSRSQQALHEETQNLVNALRRPEVRGQWGELTLRRVVELAGMVEHCDFSEQAQTEGDDGSLRPDMIIHLPENRTLVVDVKTPLDAYLEATAAKDAKSRQTALKRHARHVRERVRELSSKSYWSQFDGSPEFVILFVPGEQFLSAALDIEPNLNEEAIKQKVLLTTPNSLIALLKVVAYGWRQMTLAENAEHIRDLGQDLYHRLTTFIGHLSKLGRQLGSSVDAFNSAVGSLERKVLPGARKFIDMGIPAPKEMPALEPLDKTTRQLQSPQDEDTAEEKDAAGS